MNNIFNYPLSFIKTKIDIYIRHTHSFRIEKAFEEQAILKRIYSGYSQYIGNQAAGCRTPPRSHRDLIVASPIDQILHNQKIGGKTHLIDYLQFESNSFIYDGIRLGKNLPGFFPYQLAEILLRSNVFLQLKMG
jgi:hypothetical protein